MAGQPTQQKISTAHCQGTRLNRQFLPQLACWEGSTCLCHGRRFHCTAASCAADCLHFCPFHVAPGEGRHTQGRPRWAAGRPAGARPAGVFAIPRLAAAALHTRGTAGLGEVCPCPLFKFLALFKVHHHSACLAVPSQHPRLPCPLSTRGSRAPCRPPSATSPSPSQRCTTCAGAA